MPRIILCIVWRFVDVTLTGALLILSLVGGCLGAWGRFPWIPGNPITQTTVAFLCLAVCILCAVTTEIALAQLGFAIKDYRLEVRYRHINNAIRFPDRNRSQYFPAGR